MFEKSLGLLTFSQDEISSWILTYTLPSAVAHTGHTVGQILILYPLQ